MRKYEVMIMVDMDVDERQVPGLIDKHLEVVTKGGGTIDKVDIMGRKTMAYEINKKSEASYAVAYLTANPTEVQELDRLLGIDEKIVRTKVLRLED